MCAQSTRFGASPRPNFLWLTSEDNGPELGCYGDSYANTPNIDALAAKSLRYINCWSNAPVCAPARTTLLTGMYPTSLGAQHMRSHVRLPPQAQLYPQLFHEMGYYCSNHSKEDYNVETPEGLWDESSNKAHWRKRRAGQPFFAVFNSTISHESKLRTRPHKAIHDPAKVTIPPYHPDTPEVRQDWAQYYDRITEMDREVGQILQQLQDDGLADSTIVFYYGDHGSGMPRGKRWLYQSGLRVPLIVHIPERYQSLLKERVTAGSTSERLVSFVDFMPTLLSLAGERPAPILQGKAFLGKYATEEPEYIYGFRDRMDERYDMSRAVRDKKFLYIRNFFPQRPQGTYLDYMFQTPTTRVWKQLFEAGKLDAAQSFFWETKPAEELYDLETDPYQIKNLAGTTGQQATLERLREATQQWMIHIKDLGLLPEGHMLELAGEDAPYTMGHDTERYPIEKIYSVADLATRPTKGDLNELAKHQVDSSQAVRYWVACGLLLRAQENQERDQAVKMAGGMTVDPSPYVRCMACETVARYGRSMDRKLAIDSLLNMSDPRITNTFVTVAALNSLDWCDPTAAEIGSSLQGLPANVPTLSKRYDTLIPKLLKRIESRAQ
ncbi:MAG: sulfatase [Planctomycetales bacterium]|nr:sulfatase [Planctomycetales bacterium]